MAHVAEGLSSLCQGAWGHLFGVFADTMFGDGQENGKEQRGDHRKVPPQTRLPKELRKLSSLLGSGEIPSCFAAEKPRQANSPTNRVWKWHRINASLELRHYFSGSHWPHEHIKKKQKSKTCGGEVISVNKLVCISYFMHIWPSSVD